MAKIRDSAVTQLTTEAATISVTLPTHATNDLLLVFLSKDAVVTATGSALGHAWQVDNSGGPSYTDQTTVSNNATASDWGFFPAGAGASDAVEVGFTNPFSVLRVVLGTAGAGTYTVTWQYYNSASTWVNLSGVVDGTNAFKNAAATYNVSFTIPTDWAPAVINGSASLYWIRAQRDGGTETTRPLGTQGFINQWTETASSGWAIAGQRDGTGCCQMWAYKKATSASETNPTFSQGDVDSMIAVAISVSGVHTSFPLDVTDGIGSTTSGSGTETVSGLATVNANALCFYVLTEVTGTGPTPEPGLQRLVSDDTASVGLGVGWTFQATSGTPASHVFYCNASSALTGVKNFIALRDDGNATEIPPYHDRATTLATMVSPITGGAFPYGESYPNSVTITSVGGKTCTFDTVASTADSGVNPFHSMALTTTALNAANLGGPQVTMSAKDISSSTGILVGTYRFTTPRDYIDTGFYATGGIQLLIGEVVGSNDYKSWMVGAQRAKTTNADNRNWYAIQPAQSTATHYAVSGTAPNLSAITFLQLMQTSPLGTGSLGWSQLILANKVVVAGGSTTNPIDFDGVLSVINGYIMQLGIPQASGAVQMYCPVQFGGSKAIIMDAKNFQIQFPKAADTANGFMDFHVDNNVVGLIFDGRAGDQIKMRTCLVQSLSPWKFEFLATVSTSCTWDFDGMTVIGATPTLRNIGTSTTAGYQNMSFVECSNFDSAGATLTGCTINDSTSTQAVTVTSTANMALITNCTFTTNTRAINITTAGTYASVGNIFTSNTYDIDNSSSGANVADIYSESNSDGTIALNDTVIGVSQSFTGDGNVLANAVFYLSKSNTPTGTATAKVYAHSGTFASSSLPTGTALATSQTLDVSTLTGSLALTTFYFIGDNNITLTNATKYVVTIEYGSGTGANTVNVGRDASSASAAGSCATLTGSTWTSTATTTDACFYVRTGGIVIVNATNSSNPSQSKVINSAAIPGSTTINNTVSLTVTVLDKTDNGPIKLAQVAVYRTSDDIQLMNEDTETVTTGFFVVGVVYRIVNVGDTDFTLIGASSNTVGVVFTATGVGGGTTGTATNGVAVDTFNYVSNTPIYVRIRKSLAGETKYVPLSTTGTITSTGYTLTVTMTQDTNA